MRAIQTELLPSSDPLSSRIKAFDRDGNWTTVDWRTGLNHEQNHIRAARALCDKMRWKGKLATGYDVSGYTHVFVNGSTWWAT